MHDDATAIAELHDLRRDLDAMTAERDLYRRALARVVGHMPSRHLAGAMSDSDLDNIDDGQARGFAAGLGFDPASRFESYAS